MKNIRLRQLDGLRGLFALLVVTVHYPYRDSIWTSNLIVRQCDMFVDFFFVLSGFVISYTYYDSIKSFQDFKDYIWKRFLRLYPLLIYTVLIFLLFKMLFSYFEPHLLTHPETPSQLYHQTLDSISFMNSTPVFGTGLGMNYPSWSISAEMIAYVCFGIGILLFASKKQYFFLLSLVLAALFLAFKGNYMMEGDWGFMRALVCFNAGLFTFLLFKKYHSIIIHTWLEYAIPFLLLGLFYFRWQLNGVNRQMFSLAVLPLFFSAFIFIYALSGGYFVRSLSKGFLKFIGKISYSLYLNHAIILILATKFFFDVIKIPKNEFTILISLLFSIAVTIIYSRFTFIYIEKKGNSLFRKGSRAIFFNPFYKKPKLLNAGKVKSKFNQSDM